LAARQIANMVFQSNAMIYYAQHQTMQKPSNAGLTRMMTIMRLSGGIPQQPKMQKE